MTRDRHPALTIAVPPSWRRRARPELGVVVAARAPSLPASGVRPELVLRTVSPEHDDLEAWRIDALGELSEVLVDFALEDDAVVDLVGHRVVYHRFAHRVGTVDVLCDQWSWLVDGLGVTLTCAAARVDYPVYADLFEAVAESVEPRASAA